MLSRNEFKVFDLLPLTTENHDEPDIRGGTRVLPLPTNESYEALSYVWGRDPPEVRIGVNGCDFLVTPTLATALWFLQLPDRSRTLWIDQECIAQDDDDEKATQVPLMSQIYSSTAQGLIWMGDISSDIALEDAASAIELLTYFHDEVIEAPSRDGSPPSCLASKEAIAGPMAALRSIGIGQNPWW